MTRTWIVRASMNLHCDEMRIVADQLELAAVTAISDEFPGVDLEVSVREVDVPRWGWCAALAAIALILSQIGVFLAI